MIRRGKPFIEVAYFLSRFGNVNPPEDLQTNSWKEAYLMFFEKLNEGRTIDAFIHSLKNSRDGFDSHFSDNGREGWKNKNGAAIKLSGLNLEIFLTFKDQSKDAIWERVKEHCKLDTKTYKQEFDNLSAIEESEKDTAYSKTEGGVKIFISHKIERNPSLRNDAFKVHGYDCTVCGFNFEKTYGTWGRNWAEVHHLKPISSDKVTKRITNPRTDLVIVCANCHRMIHRRKGIVLTVAELKEKIQNS